MGEWWKAVDDQQDCPASSLHGCGHWTQQERPAEVNAELVEFLGRQR